LVFIAPDGGTTGTTVTVPADGSTPTVPPAPEVINFVPKNDSWMQAKDTSAQLTTANGAPVTIVENLSGLNESRWFKFKGTPGGAAFVWLSNLDVNLDESFYRDIAPTYGAIKDAATAVPPTSSSAPTRGAMVSTTSGSTGVGVPSA